MAVRQKQNQRAQRRNGREPSVPDLSKEQELAAYREMLLIRRFEEKAGQLYGMGLIGGFCHLYIGQEAVVVGMQMALEEGDQVITGYRDHGHMLACGMDPKGVMAELTGRRGGYSKGKGGSMHMFSVEKGFYGGHGIVGAQVPLGTGLAFANRYRENDNVVPDLFRRRRRQPGPGLRELQHGGAVEAAGRLHHREQPLRHGHLGRALVGADRFLQARRLVQHSGRAGRRHGCARRARPRARRRSQWCRDGKGPYILEMQTYRYRGHSMSDPAKYRTREEVRRCAPSTIRSSRCARGCSTNKRASEDELKKIDAEVRDIVNEAAEFATHDPEPDPSELWTDVVR